MFWIHPSFAGQSSTVPPAMRPCFWLLVEWNPIAIMFEARISQPNLKIWSNNRRGWDNSVRTQGWIIAVFTIFRSIVQIQKIHSSEYMRPGKPLLLHDSSCHYTPSHLCCFLTFLFLFYKIDAFASLNRFVREFERDQAYGMFVCTYIAAWTFFLAVPSWDLNQGQPAAVRHANHLATPSCLLSPFFVLIFILQGYD